MCWSCNPYCGFCKPPKPKPRQCSQCKAYNVNPDEKKCRKCGAELPPPVPPPVVQCLYSGMICANPCGKYKKPSPDGKVIPCKLNTPPQTESDSE